jgi:hypothetical protein
MRGLAHLCVTQLRLPHPCAIFWVPRTTASRGIHERASRLSCGSPAVERINMGSRSVVPTFRKPRKVGQPLSWRRQGQDQDSRSKASDRGVRPTPATSRANGRSVRPTLANVVAAFVVARGNSRFLTGLSAQFGMTSLFRTDFPLRKIRRGNPGSRWDWRHFS